MNIKPLLFTLALVCAAPAISHADEFKTVQLDKSSLTFGFKQMGVSMDGHFKKFTALMNFDPAKPANAKAQLELDLASIDVGSDEGNDEVAGKQWFNTKTFPKASFVANSVKAVGGIATKSAAR
jgi:polyisoprenoid-binding protein YceI